MATKTHTPAIPWQDRWNEPTIEALLKSMNEQHRRVTNTMMKEVHKLLESEPVLKYYDVSWNWTIHYAGIGLRGTDSLVMAYIVPDPVEGPLVCVPLTEDTLTALPRRRLTRFIREGIDTAKCAIHLFWAKWRPTSVGEAELIVDVIKRKRNILRTRMDQHNVERYGPKAADEAIAETV